MALGLPALEAMFSSNGTALADGSPIPKRFGVFFWGAGVRLARWVPSTTGADWALTPELEPFAKVRQNITVVSGTTCRAPGTVHHAGQAGMMSGYGAPADANDSSTYSYPSIDVLVARAWRPPVDFNLLNLAVIPGWPSRGTPGNLSFNGTGFNSNETSPTALFDRLIAQGMASTDGVGSAAAASARRAAARSRVLDAVKRDRDALRKRLGAADRRRLDEHLEGVDSLQRRLALATERTRGSAALAACPASPRPSGELDGDDRIEARHRAMVDVLLLALACDMNRVFTYQFSTWYSAIFRELGQRDNAHVLTHDEPDDQPQVDAWVTFTMRQYAHLIERLAATPEGDGTLLDRTLILGCSDVAEGKSHNQTDMPIVLAGGRQSGINLGLHIRQTNTSAYRMHVALLKALGFPSPTFGYDDRLEKEPLAGLLP